MGACGGRECGGGPELPAAGKAVYDKWASGKGKDHAATKDATTLTAWALLYRKLTHRMLNDELDESCIVHALNDVKVVGPKGSHYHFEVYHVHSDYNKQADNVTWCVVRDPQGNWGTDTKCKEAAK